MKNAASIYAPLVILSVFAVCAALFQTSRDNVPFAVFFTGALVVAAIIGAVHELKAKS